jgi:uncharacterized Zn-finger protein
MNRIFLCDECDIKFNSMSQLKIHHKQHRGEITYKCEVCDQLFLHEYLLKRHKVVHTDKKPYKCKLCNAEFGWTSSIRQHILRAHKDKVIDAAGHIPHIYMLSHLCVVYGVSLVETYC